MSNQAKAASAAVKLMQAAALAAALVPLGSVPAEATSVTCTFFSGGGVSSNCTFDESSSIAAFRFDPDGDGDVDYKLLLSFDVINNQFDVTVTDHARDQAFMAAKFGTVFAGYLCVPIYPENPPSTLPQPFPCVEFEVSAPLPGPNTWTSVGPRGPNATDGYDMTIGWAAATDGAFPDSPGGRIRLLHDTGGSPTYDIDITKAGSYFSATDPGILGRDDNFQFFTAAQAPVPEPASLILLASGLSGLLYRRRLLTRGGTPRASRRGPLA